MATPNSQRSVDASIWLENPKSTWPVDWTQNLFHKMSEYVDWKNPYDLKSIHKSDLQKYL